MGTARVCRVQQDERVIAKVRRAQPRASSEVKRVGPPGEGLHRVGQRSRQFTYIADAVQGPSWASPGSLTGPNVDRPVNGLEVVVGPVSYSSPRNPQVHIVRWIRRPRCHAVDPTMATSLGRLAFGMRGSTNPRAGAPVLGQWNKQPMTGRCYPGTGRLRPSVLIRRANLPVELNASAGVSGP